MPAAEESNCDRKARNGPSPRKAKVKGKKRQGGRKDKKPLQTGAAKRRGRPTLYTEKKWKKKVTLTGDREKKKQHLEHKKKEGKRGNGTEGNTETKNGSKSPTGEEIKCQKKEETEVGVR